MEEHRGVVAEEALRSLQETAGFEIAECTESVELSDKSRYTKLSLSSGQKMQMSTLMHNVPMAVTAAATSNMYIAKFPAGLPHTLTALKQGGFGSMIRGVDGKFVGTASFYEASSGAMLLGGFTAMSVASGQYFMAQINKELKMINLKMDKILEFLYGDKKAELLSEISFVRYAFQNFSAIMEQDVQRVATISSLQGAKKVAMKDIEFYLSDLDATVLTKTTRFAALEEQMEKAFQIRESLELSKQLYIMSSLLEMQYAQNTDSDYLAYLEMEVTTYIDKCDKRILSSFSNLKGKLDAYKSVPMEKADKTPYIERIVTVVDSLNSGEESSTKKSIREVIHAAKKEKTYYIKQDGSVYMQNGD